MSLDVGTSFLDLDGSQTETDEKVHKGKKGNDSFDRIIF